MTTRVRILVGLAVLWRRHPSWRFTQMVVNVAGENDPYHVDDEEFLARLKRAELPASAGRYP